MAGLKSSTRTVGNEVHLYIWEPKAEVKAIVSAEEVAEAYALFAAMSDEQKQSLLSI